ncbi:MAG: STAS domain-containing protein [Anaerolineales bacterium]|nr:STAS domain-containing protein [Anaerolineales bacterium]
MDLVKVTQMQGRVPVTVFHIQDRINLGNYKLMEDAAREAFENGTRDLVIDLSASESLTSIGVRALVIIHKVLSADGGRHLKLAGVMPSIREMLGIAGITQFIEVYDTLDEAVASF